MEEAVEEEVELRQEGRSEATDPGQAHTISAEASCAEEVASASVAVDQLVPRLVLLAVHVASESGTRSHRSSQRSQLCMLCCGRRRSPCSHRCTRWHRRMRGDRLCGTPYSTSRTSERAWPIRASSNRAMDEQERAIGMKGKGDLSQVETS